MKTALPKSFQILPGTAMRFSCKAVLADRPKRDGSYALYLQAIINRKKAKVNLGITVQEAHFDSDRGTLKANTPNAELINFQIAEATMKANKIYLDYRYADRYLDPEKFRKEFTDPEATGDFTAFMEKEIELRKPKLSKGSYGSNINVFKKLKSFKNKILFCELTVEFLQKFQNYLIKHDELSPNTIHRAFRTIKIYINLAVSKEIKFKNPFKDYHVKQVTPSRSSLTFEELQILFDFFKTTANKSHQKLLRYFLFSCVTGVRISDVGILKKENIHDGILIFLPYKTREKKRYITIPLNELHLNLIGSLDDKIEKDFLFETFAKKTSNELLKDIAKAVGIKKHLTYHISRHTFATQFLNKGGNLETLQQMLGHSMITTTMQYVKVEDSRKRSELSKAFDSLQF